MLLDIEARIGEMLPAPSTAVKGTGLKGQKGAKGGATKEKVLPKGLTSNRAWQARVIAKHPEIVAKVKARARKYEVIPTPKDVVNEVREAKRRKEWNEEQFSDKPFGHLEKVVQSTVDTTKFLREHLIELRTAVNQMGPENIIGWNGLILKKELKELFKELQWLWDLIGRKNLKYQQ